jgi:flagellar basal body-associated protein FliL
MQTRETNMRSILAAFALLPGLIALPAWADDAAPKHKETQSDSFIMIEPMYTTVVDAGRPDGMLLVAIGLDIPDPTLRAQANLGMPVLRDAYVRSLMSYSAAVVRPDHQPDVGLIADRLQRVTDRELHRKGARVLLAQVALQPRQN